MRTLPTGTVSFLFTDIQGSTELLHHLGDQTYGEVLLTHQRLLRAAFSEHEGTEVDTQGDAFFVAFPRAWNAVAAAVTAQRALAIHPWPEGVTVRVRMGIHTGEPTLAGDHYVGLDVHRAARVAATGYGQQVLLSERAHAMTQASLPDGVAVRDLGEHRLKDIPRPERIYQLVMPGLPADFPPLKSLEVLVTNLPALQLTSFVGREREMAEIKGQLGAVRLLTLLGPGGTGKTRLALEVGAGLLEGFPRGVWLAELAPAADPELVTPTVATVFNVREAAGRPLVDSLVDYLKPRDLLLILDNCEHVIEAAAGLADALLRACPHVRILATSREPLGVHGESTYRVPPLARPDATRRVTADSLVEFEAARLFIERAALSSPKFVVTDANAPAVARVVSRLDGIPLAIELAAARVKVLPVEQIAQRLDDRFRLLTAGSRTGLPHHQTLRGAIDWSHDLLSEPERVLFRRLSVFAGGASLEAAEAVCTGDGVEPVDALDLIARLVDKSLLITEEVTGDVRYRMLETIRHYGQEKLAAAGEEAPVRERHLQWHLALAEDAAPHLRGPEQVTWLDRLELDHDDLRAALKWGTQGQTEAVLRLAGGLHLFWARRGYLSEGRERLDAVLAHATVPAPARAKVLYGAALLAFDQGDYVQAQARAEESLSLHRALGDDLGAALSLNILGNVARNQGEYGLALKLLEESEAASRQRGHTWALAEALNSLGLTARRQRDHDRARKFLEEGLGLWREIGDKWGLAAALGHLGVVARVGGDIERARSLHEESLALRRELGDRRNIAAALVSLAAVALEQEDYERARARFEESLDQSRDLGDRLNMAAALGSLGLVATLQGEYERAESLYRESLELYQTLGDKLNVANAHAFLGGLALRRGDDAQAVAEYQVALKMFVTQGDRLGIAECLEGSAHVPAGQGRDQWAARLLGAADRVRESLGTPVPPADRPDYDRVLADLRVRLGEVVLSQAWAQGRAMSLQEAIDEALQPGDQGVPSEKPKEHEILPPAEGSPRAG